MKVAILLCALAAHTCGYPTETEEQSVVSVYTTQPTTAGTAPLDVYHQIANNIAERITSPIYRFLGIAKNKTDDGTTTSKPWSKIELLDEPEDMTHSVRPLDNDIAADTDAEVSDAKRRSDRKPEKITLYSNYLPSSERIELTTVSPLEEEKTTALAGVSGSRNKSINDVDLDDEDDEPFEFDDVEEGKQSSGGLGGPLVYIMELLGSFFQIAWGAIQALFTPKAGRTDSG